MHVEPPKAPLISLKEFGLHYLMIVVSILTAIGLEEILRAYHNHQAALAAEQAIETELRANLKDLREAIRDNRERRDELRKVGDALAEDIRASKDAEALKQKVIKDYVPKLTVGLSLPGVGHDAWDVAVASQAATLIPHAKLSAYSDLYSMERDAMAGANSGMLMFEGAGMTNYKADAEVGIAEPRRLLELLRQAAMMNAVGLGNLTVAEKAMAEEFDKAGLAQQ